MTLRTRMLLVLLVAYLAAPPVARAHALDPSLLELVETTEGVEVTWRNPVAQIPGAEPVRPVLPCRAVEPTVPTEPATPWSREITHRLGLPETAVSSATADRRTWVSRWMLDCEGEGLDGREIAVEGLGSQSAEVLVRRVDLEGRTEQWVLDAGRPAIHLGGQPGGQSVFGVYTVLGVEHIWGGFDHLAFVTSLVLLVHGGRRLVWTLTAFTVGHSLTLGLVVLDRIRLPSAAVELAIALSILLLAVELASKPASRRASPGPIGRRPWLVAGAFGLLHGCGFAGALREVGLPQGEVPMALVAFNVGIELGQIAYVLAFWGLALLLGQAVARLPSRRGAPANDDRTGLRPGRYLERPIVYLLGSLAAYWTLDRLAGLV